MFYILKKYINELCKIQTLYKLKNIQINTIIHYKNNNFLYTPI